MGKRKCFLVLDTETCGSLEEPLVYDLGAQVIDLSGHELESASWTIYDIYAGQRELMQTAYYAEKLPQYEVGMKNGQWQMKRFYNARKQILTWLEDYDVIAVCAYNASFDRKALNNTLRFLTEGKSRFFFPYGTEFIDIWTMASSTIFKTARYRKMAYENNWVSPHGNVRTTAEHAYRYLTGNIEYEERHTALEDVKIEVCIFLHCWKRCKSEEKRIVSNPWKLPQGEWYYTEARKDGVI